MERHCATGLFQQAGFEKLLRLVFDIAALRENLCALAPLRLLLARQRSCVEFCQAASGTRSICRFAPNAWATFFSVPSVRLASKRSSRLTFHACSSDGVQTRTSNFPKRFAWAGSPEGVIR